MVVRGNKMYEKELKGVCHCCRFQLKCLIKNNNYYIISKWKTFEFLVFMATDFVKFSRPPLNAKTVYKQ